MYSSGNKGENANLSFWPFFQKTTLNLKELDREGEASLALPLDAPKI